MIKRLLIANRGEIAVRVIRACRDMGIVPIAVFSEADRGALHVRYADEAYCIGPPAPGESYLDGEAILRVAHDARADAIHPGYGFLSENSDFVRAVHDAGITFVGPGPDVMDLMGSKIEARKSMMKLGVPVVPGSDSALDDGDGALAAARDVGFPLVVKATAGGGGKGMRVVESEDAFLDALASARTEAANAFGDDTIYLERLVTEPHHVEIQVFGDGQGNGIHLFERECSAQRRHQKVIEESPSPTITPEVRAAMGALAARVTGELQYSGAGTFEFLVDDQLNFYFLEMNTRLQVEHPVTEMVTGLDLVHLQLAVASGEPLPPQDSIRQRGWAMECRVYAEDPARKFMPSPGVIRTLREPGGPGVRVDTGITAGSEISRYYDAMIAKLITWADSRDEAVNKMQRALREYNITGLTHNIAFLRNLLASEPFRAGTYDTSLIGDGSAFVSDATDAHHRAALIAALLAAHRKTENGMGRVATPESTGRANNWKLSGRWGQLTHTADRMRR